MKKITKIFGLLAVAAGFTLSSCIEETFPESSTVTSEQVGASSSALEALVSGIPAQMAQGYLVYGDQVHETDMAYPQFMIAFTEMMGDMYPLTSNYGYDWYYRYNTFNAGFGKNGYYSFLTWFTLYKFVKSANDVIASVDFENETNPEIKGYAGAAYACRAFDYFLLTVLFEPVENIYTDCSKVLGLTVTKVTEETTPDDAKNSPRLTHDEMIEFILSDLDKAEEALSNYTPSSKLLPNLAVVYGLKAKVYLWDEDYANAAKYARMAIDESGATPVTETQWEDPTTGFAQANQAWMWYIKYSAENMGNLCNFTGWMSGEADWGYASLTCPGIDASLYDKMSDTDFRKHTFLDPDKYDYYDYKTCRDEEFINNKPAYLALKFRCLQGNYETYSIGGAVDVPIMRVEEMYFIEAYATGMSQGVSAGLSMLNDFIKTYRDPNYNGKANTERDFQLALLTQMRIEFWGEGNAFPLAKRIQPDVVQNYEGTNAPAEIFKINCKGIKPNWTLMIPLDEMEANAAITDDTNNPDPSNTVATPVEIGTFAPANN